MKNDPPGPHRPQPILLVGTDFSPCAALAAREAKEVARELGALIEVLHVDASGNSSPEEASAWMHDAGIAPESLRIRGGTPWVELARDAAARNARFVFVGTHGRGGFHPVGVGSTAARLASGSSRPVVLVGPRGSVAMDSGVRMPIDPESRRTRLLSF